MHLYLICNDIFVIIPKTIQSYNICMLLGIIINL